MNFIEQLAPLAIKHGKANGVLPSMIIAQGILESRSGTSELARKANNLFGIKAGSGWTGGTYTVRTSEQGQHGNVTYINAAFRKYPSYEGCVIDLVHKYTHGTGWEDHNRYAGVLGQTDYKKAITALKAAGYAADVKYAEKLIERIEQYNLTKYDKEEPDMPVIFIDPGHGGKDPGGGTNKQFTEKDMVLKISLEQKRHFERNGIKVVMTRTNDEYVDSVPRTNRVKASGAQYCISNHINAGGGEGAETIHSIHASPVIATGILDALVACGAKKRRVFSRKGNGNTDYYYMHRMTGSVSTVIVEYGFADNTSDTQKIIKDWKKYAEAVARYYIEHVFKKKYVAEVQTEKEDDELEFTSGTLRNTVEGLLSSHAKQKQLIEDGIKAGSFGTVWRDKFDKKQLGKHDILGLYMLHHK
ncbi:glucosaminidase domain-containing protein [Sporosarcina sp. Te-1]|uniref:glucosaminidase domain-containing protein n=1 Tax=Sporosarcina sp. Te-1 TaxID=2818390 RepID=UPI001A9D31EB|nr:glucosaminidase domain-containing protein [Sporosarcina sp. Te-1]QTD40629.1 N-acetylmuramoyl-L-alanine amidase [Sporosarcina sp. Te-1]